MPWLPAAGGGFLLLLVVVVGFGNGLHIEVGKIGAEERIKANSEILVRNKREWIIPPVPIMEEQDNSARNPIAKIRSDYQQELKKRITYKITGKGVTEPPYGLFIIDERTGDLSVTGIVDREETPIFFLKGYALDIDGNNVEPPLDLRIKVVDINDNNPVFTNEVFIGTVDELSAANTLVIRLNATDADEENTLNSKLAYRIVSQEPGNSQIFIMNKATGEVRTTVSNLDREQQSSYSLVVEVKDRDGEQIGLAGKSILKVKVRDVNDNIPVLEREQYEGTVEENVANMEILRMKAFDDDEEFTDNWWANFTIVSGNEEGYFEIVTDTTTNEGVLMIVKEVDYEELQNVEMSVVVSNKAEYHSSIRSIAGGSSSSSIGGAGGGAGGGGGAGAAKRIPIKVRVKNVPEGPVFRPKRKILTVSEGTKTTISQVIGSYQALDGDTGKIAQHVKYAKEYDPDNWFTIDSTTSEIKLAKIPDRESKYVINGTYIAKILAISEDLTGKTATGTIAIQVDDVNDNCPSIIEPVRTICDDSKTINVTAVDKDSFPFGAPFKFTIVDEPVGIAKNWVIGKKNDVSVELIPENIRKGLHKIQVLVTDNQGMSCPEKQVLQLTVCTCTGGDSCSLRMSDNSVGLGAGAVGLMILACLLLLLVPLLLLLCYCGSGGKGFMAIPDGTEATFVKWNNEGAAPEDMAVMPNPVVISSLSAVGGAAGAGAMRGDGGGSFGMDGYDYNSKGIYTSERIDERRGLLTTAEIAGGAGGTSGNTMRSIGMLGSGSGSGAGGGQGAFGATLAGRSSAALNEDFIKGYFHDKALAYADEDEAQPAKDCLLVYSQEDAGSSAGSVGCCSFIESEFDEDNLGDLGMKFKALADICTGGKISTNASVKKYQYEEVNKVPTSNYSREVIDAEANMNVVITQEAEQQAALTMENTYSSSESKIHRVEPETVVRENVIAEESYAPTRYVDPMYHGNVLVTEKSYTTGPMMRMEPLHQQNVLVTERVIRPASSFHNLIDVADGQNVLVTERVIQSDTGRSGLVGVGDLHGSKYMVVTEQLLAPNSGQEYSMSSVDQTAGQNVLVTERHYTPISGMQSNVLIPTELSSSQGITRENFSVADGGVQGHFVTTEPLFNQGGYLMEEMPPSSNVGKSSSRVSKYSTVQYTRS